MVLQANQLNQPVMFEGLSCSCTAVRIPTKRRVLDVLHVLVAGMSPDLKLHYLTWSEGAWTRSMIHDDPSWSTNDPSLKLSHDQLWWKSVQGAHSEAITIETEEAGVNSSIWFQSGSVSVYARQQNPKERPRWVFTARWQETRWLDCWTTFTFSGWRKEALKLDTLMKRPAGGDTRRSCRSTEICTWCAGAGLWSVRFVDIFTLIQTESVKIDDLVWFSTDSNR